VNARPEKIPPAQTGHDSPAPDAPSPRDVRLAMLGMIEGNAHPYSWSAIINGYDRQAMQTAIGERYPVILDYLGLRPTDEIRIPGARVTHVWTDDPVEAPQIAASARIPHVLARPEEAIGHIDGAIIATDDGNDHVERARPFIEAGIPVFIDKPLAINLPDLRQFVTWHEEGKTILSSSGLRYSPEVQNLHHDRASFGDLRWITGTMVKSWERYGVHALEPIFTLTGPGAQSVTMTGSGGNEVATISHRNGLLASIAILPNAPGGSGIVHAYATAANRSVKMADTYTAFRGQMLAFVETVRSGRHPYPFAETIEIMLILIAGLRSREAGGRPIHLDELRQELLEEIAS
jgi:predicted dehydrogenase